MLRLAPGERVDVTDGAGTRLLTRVIAAARGSVRLQVIERRVEPAPEPRLVVVQALLKSDRSGLAVELMTEAGVDEIVPWAADRCVARWAGDRAERGRQRWSAVAGAAARQSRRAHWPVIAPLASSAEVAARLAASTAAYLLHEGDGAPLAAAPLPAAGVVTLVVGPEGGLTEEELATLPASAVRLGPTVLRASSAGALAAAVVLSRTARWTLSHPQHTAATAG